MVVKGYKAFNLDKTNRYQRPFVEGETYRTEGLIKFGNDGNGFHMCKNLADVFRYFDSENVVVAEVEGRGNYDLYEDDYYGYYDMYAFEEITINRFLSREEILTTILSRPSYDVIKFLMTFKLRSDETKLFYDKFIEDHNVLKALAYYQLGERDVYKKSLDLEEVKEVCKKWTK